MKDEFFIKRCFELAKLGAGSVSPNPMVGAVLVHNGNIIGEGWHKAWGQAHAEVNCFKSVERKNQHLISQSTLYCSLEPCSHFGKTPPCVELVLQHKVPRVVVSNTDPNPLVAGKGLAKLRVAGVEVTAGVLEAEGAWLNRAFFTWISKKRTFVILKWAQSSDGFLGKTGQRTAVSGPLVRRLVHRWRAESDAILIGAATALTDDPQLDARHYFGKNPLRVLLHGSTPLPAQLKLLSDEQPALIFSPSIQNLPAHKKVIRSENDISLPEVLETLQKDNRAILLVEGGAKVLNRFIEQGLWDEIRVIESPIRLSGGVEAPRMPTNAVLHEQFKVGADNVSVYISGPSTRFIDPEPVT